MLEVIIYSIFIFVLVSSHSPSNPPFTIHSLPVLSVTSFISRHISVRITRIISILLRSYFSHSSITCSTVSSSPMSHSNPSLLLFITFHSYNHFLPSQNLCTHLTSMPFLSTIFRNFFSHLLLLTFHKYTFNAIIVFSICSSLTLYLKVAFMCIYLNVLHPMSPLKASTAAYLGAFNAILATLFCRTSNLSISFSLHAITSIPYIVLRTATLFHISRTTSYLLALIHFMFPKFLVFILKGKYILFHVSTVSSLS